MVLWLFLGSHDHGGVITTRNRIISRRLVGNYTENWLIGSLEVKGSPNHLANATKTTTAEEKHPQVNLSVEQMELLKQILM